MTDQRSECHHTSQYNEKVYDNIMLNFLVEEVLFVHRFYNYLTYKTELLKIVSVSRRIIPPLVDQLTE